MDTLLNLLSTMKRKKMFNKIKIRLDTFISLFADARFARLYLASVILIINLACFIYAIYIQNLDLINFGIFISFTILIFFIGNTSKRRNSYYLDQGFMPPPFAGLPVNQVIANPSNLIQADSETNLARVSRVMWLYFAVFAIVNSRKEKFNYHQQLIDVLREFAPELLSWVPSMYKTFKTIPPIPGEISVEDFE